MFNTVFEAIHLKKTVDSQTLLDDVSLSLEQGKILGIYGSNASSKSTLIKALAGITPIDSGFFTLEGKNISFHNPSQAAALGILAIFGEEQALPHLSIAENIFLGTYSHCTHPAVTLKKTLGSYRQEKIMEAAGKLLKYYGCDIDLKAPVASLTPAKRYLLLVLNAAVRSARVLLMDDCFTDMDDEEAKIFIHLLRRLSGEGISILFASQNYFRLQKLADSLLFIKEGKLFTSQQSTEGDFTSAFDSRSPFPYPKLPLSRGPLLYKCESLCYKNILKHISLEVYQGEMIGLLGASGSGRTTLAKTICGFFTPDKGETFFNQVNLKISSPAAAKRYGISMISSSSVFQGLIPQMSIQDNVTLSNLQAVTYRHFPFFISKRKMKRCSCDIVSRLGIDEQKNNEKIKTLSKGIQKKIVFAKSVFSGAQFFVLDEPTRDVDRAGRIQIYNLMTELAYEKNGILLFTSDIEEALGMCDRILILRNGEIIHETRPEETSSSQLHELIYH